MSDPGNVPEAPPTLIEQDGAVPETVIPAEPVVEAPAAEPEAPAPEAKAEEPEQPKKKPWWQDRLDEKTRKQRDAERRADEAEARLAAIAPPEANPEQDLDNLVEQRAEALLAKRDYDKKAQAWLTAGQKDYGKETFNEMCSDVSDMGAGDSRFFMSLVTDPEIIPDGHKVIAALRESPDETQRIMALDPVKMAAALTRFAATNSAKAPEAPISQAPAPIRPIGGSAKPSGPDDSQDIKTWLANRNATARTTAGGQANRH